MAYQYMSEVEEAENGELYIGIPLALMNQMGWTEETLLEWEIMEKNNQVTIKKIGHTNRTEKDVKEN
jgi:hypothetical protein